MFGASCRTGLILLLVSATCQAATTTTPSPSPAPASADPAPANLTSTTIPPAIIAIEIVDPNANQTVANRNTKRTIEANLGYGQQSPPKLEYYKYSQEDIPPYNGGAAASTEIFGATTPENGAQQQQFPHAPGLQQLYQPGTMLFTQLNSHGQLGQLTAGPPLNTNIQQPVIVVRVRPEQLASLTNGLFPNLPQSHPFASSLNNVDLSQLLNGYANGGLQGFEQQQQQPFGLPQQQQFHQGYPTSGFGGFDFGAGQQQQQQQFSAPGGFGGFDFGGAQPSAAGGFDFSGGAQNLATQQQGGGVGFDLGGGAHQHLLAQGPQLFQQQQPLQQTAVFPQQGGFQFPAAHQLAYPQAPGVHQIQQQPLLQQLPQHLVQQQQPLQTFENYPDNAHTRVIFKGPTEPVSGRATPTVTASPILKSKTNDDDENQHESEYSSYSSSSSDDGYHYDKPVKEAKKLFTVAENDGEYKSFPSSSNSNGFDVLPFDYDGEQTQQKDVNVNEREPYSYSYSTITSSGSNGDRSKKSTNNNGNHQPPTKIRMRVPKSLRKSMRDKREKIDD